MNKTACGAVCPDDLSMICVLEKGHDSIYTDYHCASDGEAWITLTSRVSRKGKPLCDTTMTPRNPAHLCCCVKRTDQMGPCDTFEVGGNARCVYCDHEGACHGAENPGSILRSELDESLMRANLLKCYGTRVTGFHTSTEHYRYLAEQIISLRKVVPR